MGANSSRSEQLTPDELEHIKSSWAVVMKNPEENGVYVLKTFLDKHNYYTKFQKFADIPVSEIPNTKVFRNHAASIINAINNVTLNIDNDMLFKNDLRALGRMHQKRSITEQQFQELKQVFMDILKEDFNLPAESLSAWDKTFRIAFNYVFEGMNEVK